MNLLTALNSLQSTCCTEPFWLLTRHRLKRGADMNVHVERDIYLMISLWLGSGENPTYLLNSCLKLSMYRSWKSSILSPSFANKASPKTRRISLRLPCKNIKPRISVSAVCCPAQWNIISILEGVKREGSEPYLRYGMGKLYTPRMKGTPILTYLLTDSQKLSTARGSCLNSCRIDSHNCKIVVSFKTTVGSL